MLPRVPEAEVSHHIASDGRANRQRTSQPRLVPGSLLDAPVPRGLANVYGSVHD